MMQNVFTKTLERITKETGLVGGVAIVFKNGEITFAAPYGYEDRENNIPMTLNASFDIASCSKAWTVMLAAQAVDEGLIGWDEPVQHAMKDFDMLDHYAGAHLSIRDMASHRSGLPCHDFMRNKVGGSRRNLMLKCANLDASAGFRETYQYNNHMYIVLGYLMEVLRGGESWESQIKRNIADKLGVETIRFRGLPGNMDNLERALAAAENADADALKTGVEMTRKQMVAAYEKLGVTPIDRLGEKFDPNLEEAIMQGTADDGEPGTVCMVLQKGYMMDKTVLRHAMVKVVPD